MFAALKVTPGTQSRQKGVIACYRLSRPWPPNSLKQVVNDLLARSDGKHIQAPIWRPLRCGNNGLIVMGTIGRRLRQTKI